MLLTDRAAVLQLQSQSKCKRESCGGVLQNHGYVHIQSYIQADTGFEEEKSLYHSTFTLLAC